MSQPIQTDAYWDEAADGYVATAEPFTGLFCRDAVDLAGIEPGMSLLDVATGPGALALAAEDAGAKVTAIDFSTGMIERLKARAADRNIEALRMDGQALDLPDRSFDRVCSVFGIPLFSDWRAGLAEMARVVKPDGLVVMGVADNPYGFGPNQLFAKARQNLWPDKPLDFGVPGMTALCAPDRIAAELSEVGLGSVEFHSRTHEFVLPGDVLGSGSPMVLSHPMIVGLSEPDRSRLIDEATRIADDWRDGDAIRIRGTALIAVASAGG